VFTVAWAFAPLKVAQLYLHLVENLAFDLTQAVHNGRDDEEAEASWSRLLREHR